MAVSLWERIHDKIKNDIKIIFNDYNLNELNNLQKRKLIYNFLFNNVSYDIELFTKITASRFGLIEKEKRNTPKELYNTIFEHKGVCNSISQYYKLLLDEVNVSSYYVTCNYDATLEEYGFDKSIKHIPHALNVIYDIDTNTYSFDDLSLAILNNDSNKYFAFDLHNANLLNLGNQNILNGINFLVIDESYIDMVSGRREKTNLRKQLIEDIGKVKMFLNGGLNYFDLNNNEELKKDRVIK